MPVILGTAAAAQGGNVRPGAAVLALCTAVFFQIGVNFSNDYSDGVRGTDAFRRGPARLTGAGVFQPRAVLRAAIVFFVLGAASGTGIALLTQAWWLFLVGAACLLAAWFYTGGRRPYGYAGLGEISVFLFFGLVATLGTQFVQLGHITSIGTLAACAAGFFACGVLMINNIRDIDTDLLAKKKTLAVRIGKRRARIAYAAFLLLPYVAVLLVAMNRPIAVVTFASLALAIPALRKGLSGTTAPVLVGALKQTSAAALVFALLLGASLLL